MLSVVHNVSVVYQELSQGDVRARPLSLALKAEMNGIFRTVEFSFLSSNRQGN